MNYKIDLKKATDLYTQKTTASGIANSFERGEIPYFFHTYQPQNSFIALPPEFVADLALKAGHQQLLIEVKNSMEKVRGAKARAIEQIKNTIRENKENKK